MKLLTFLKYTYYSFIVLMIGVLPLAVSAAKEKTGSGSSKGTGGSGKGTGGSGGGGGGGGSCDSSSGLTNNADFECVVGFATDIINKLVFILIGIGLLVFIWGLLQYIIAAGDEAKVKEAKQFIVFGLIAFFVMLSVWGLTNLLVNTFFPSGNGLVAPQFK